MVNDHGRTSVLSSMNGGKGSVLTGFRLYWTFPCQLDIAERRARLHLYHIAAGFSSSEELLKSEWSRHRLRRRRRRRLDCAR